MKYLTYFNQPINIEDNIDEFDDTLPEFEGHQDFYDFLQSNNVLNVFIDNFSPKYAKYCSELNNKDNITIKTYLNNCKEKKYLLYPFNWKKVPLCDNNTKCRWIDLHMDWIKTVNNKQ
jgi:hypothetical protein